MKWNALHSCESDSQLSKNLTVYSESIGTLEPLVFMEIRPQIDGTLTEMFDKRRAMGRE